jgi:hypothetical protein
MRLGQTPVISVVLRVLFAVTVVGATAFIYTTSGQLPDPVASKFGTGGNATSHMSRDAYCALMTLGALAVPLALLAVQVWLPRAKPRLVSIPNRDYWLAAEHRPQMLAYLERHTLIFGSTSALFFAGMHALIAEANSRVPPQLDNFPFLLMTGVFVLCTIAAAITLSLRFRRTS